MKGSGRPQEPDPIAVVRAWWNVAGPAMAHAAFPQGCSDGRVEVAVQDQTWLREMEIHRQELTTRMRRERGMEALREITLVLAPAGGQRLKIKLAPAPAVHRAELAPEEILSASERIPDRELGHRWAVAVGRLLAASSRGPQDRP
ncbi:MAG: hypothetical protein DMH00_06395 [Acidobacteria bacterium]|nr:MAG: hypothetical protein DMH00_06395 [Acidobacteriota bacterium]